MLRIKSLIKNLFPVLLFIVITIVINHEIVTGFASKIETNDGRLLAWTLAWDNYKLLNDPLELFQANIFYPNNNTLTYSEHAFGISLLSLPAYILSNGNPAIGFNFVMLLSYFLNSFTAYLLVKYLTKSRSAGIIGGIIFGFSSYKIFNFVHLQNMPVFYMPLLLLFMYRYLETKKLRYIIGVGMCLLIQSLSSWYHMIFIFLLFGLFILYFWSRKRFEKKDIFRFGAVLIGVFVIILPFAIPYFQFNKENQSEYKIDEVKTYSADLGGYLLPSPNTFLGSEVLPILRITKTSWSENFNFIGYIALFLSIISFIQVKGKGKFTFEFKIEKNKLIFVAVGFIFFILSLGPFLRLHDVTTRIPLPYFVIYHLLPSIRFIRVVSRFSTVVFLMVSILSGFGYLKLEQRLKKKFLKITVLLAFTCLILLEYFPFADYRKYTDVSNIPEVYNEVKNNPEVKALVELPIDVGPFVTTGYIYWAGYHIKPIVNGYSGFQPSEYPDLVNIITQFPDTLSLAKLKNIGVTHLITNPDYQKNLSTEYLELVFEAEGYKLYKIKDNIDEARFYYDNFTNTISQNFGEVVYSKNDIEVNQASEFTPLSNISPKKANKIGVLEISTENEISKLFLNFRAHSPKDWLKIQCSESESYNFTNTQETYLNEPIELNCHTKKILIDMYSSEFKGRAMITMIAFQ